jgi:hypothetical protein
MGLLQSPAEIVAAAEPAVQNRRRHVRYPIPARCAFMGEWHAVGDVSVGGFSIVDCAERPRPGSVHEVQILFPLTDYSLILSLEARVAHADDETGRVGFAFSDDRRSAEAVIRTLIDAYVANEVVSAGDVLEVSKRFNDAKARGAAGAKKDKPKKTLADRVTEAKRGLKAIAFFALGLGLTYYVARNLYATAFLKSATSAFVEVETIEVGALGTGTVSGLAPRDGYARGDLILSIRGRDGAAARIESPCDCAVLATATAEGAFVREGDALLTLAPHEPAVFIRAQIDPAVMMRLHPSTHVDIAYRDGARIAYVLEDMPMRPVATPDRLQAVHGITARLEAGRADVEARRNGEPVRVVFDSSPFDWLRRFLLL